MNQSFWLCSPKGRLFNIYQHTTDHQFSTHSLWSHQLRGRWIQGETHQLLKDLTWKRHTVLVTAHWPQLVTWPRLTAQDLGGMEEYVDIRWEAGVSITLWKSRAQRKTTSSEQEIPFPHTMGSLQGLLWKHRRRCKLSRDLEATSAIFKYRKKWRLFVTVVLRVLKKSHLYKAFDFL